MLWNETEHVKFGRVKFDMMFPFQTHVVNGDIAIDWKMFRITVLIAEARVNYVVKFAQNEEYFYGLITCKLAYFCISLINHSHHHIMYFLLFCVIIGNVSLQTPFILVNVYFTRNNFNLSENYIWQIICNHVGYTTMLSNICNWVGIRILLLLLLLIIK